MLPQGYYTLIGRLAGQAQPWLCSLEEPCLTAIVRGNRLRATCLVVVVVAGDSKIIVAGLHGVPPQLAEPEKRDSELRPSIRRRGSSHALQRGI